MSLRISLLLLALPTPALAQAFNIDVEDLSAGVPTATYGAASGQVGLWQPLAASITPTALTDVFGAATGATVETTPAPHTHSRDLASPCPPGTEDGSLLRDHYAFAEPRVWTFRGLAAATYEVYTYAWNPDEMGRTLVQVQTNGATVVGGASCNSPLDFVAPTTHAFDVVTLAPFQDLVITVSPTEKTNGVVNGFQLIPLPLGENFCIAAPNSASASGAVMSASGSTSVSANSLVVQASVVPAGEPGIFFFGPTQTQIDFGQGFRCVSPSPGFPLQRMNPHATANGAGVLSYSVDTQGAAYSGFLATSIGAPIHFQAWYRDPAGGGSGFNLSDGLTLIMTP